MWTAKFSMDGSFLCTAGQEPTVYVWAVQGPAQPAPELAPGVSADEAPIFSSQPIRSYHGHKADVIDVAWSRSNFILSASMDNTVKLWHVTRNEVRHYLPFYYM